MPLSLDHDLLALVFAPLEMHHILSVRLVCKSFRAAAGDIDKREGEAQQKYTQVQRPSVSTVLLHTRLGKHAVEFSAIDPSSGNVAREYVVRVNQQRFVGRVSMVYIDGTGAACVAVLWARNGLHHSDGRVTWVSKIRTDLIQITFVYRGQKAFVDFELRDALY